MMNVKILLNHDNMHYNDRNYALKWERIIYFHVQNAREGKGWSLGLTSK